MGPSADIHAISERAASRALASRARSGHDQRDSGAPVSAGSWQARVLSWAACGAAEGGRADRTLAVGRPGLALCGEPAPPPAHGVHMQAGLLAGGARVGTSARGVQHDLRTHPDLVGSLMAPGRLLQPVALGGSQDDRAGGSNGQGRQADHQKWILPEGVCRATRHGDRQHGPLPAVPQSTKSPSTRSDRPRPHRLVRARRPDHPPPRPIRAGQAIVPLSGLVRRQRAGDGAPLRRRLRVGR